MALPTFQAVGAGSETSCAWPTHAIDDLAILAVEYGGGTVATPTGFTIFPCSPILSNSLMALFYRKATSTTEAAAALSGGSDHMWGVISTFRGVDTTNPIHAVAVYGRLGATTAAKMPGLYTRVADCHVAYFLSWDIDSAGPIASAPVSADLASVTERYDEGTLTGNGGGLIVITGDRATAGEVRMGTLTITSSSHGVFSVALQPPQAAAGGAGRILIGAM